MKILRRYLDRLYDAVYSRQEIKIEKWLSKYGRHTGEGSTEARLRFPDGSLLEVREVVVATGSRIEKLSYSYHYQDAAGNLIFRYDNAPHHREVPTFPHHKHTPEGVFSTKVPDLVEILREIDSLLYQR